MNNTVLKHRLTILAVVFGSVIFIYCVRLMNLQIVHGEEYKELANSSSVRVQTIQSTRGEIIDRNGRPLASNQITYDIILDKAFLPKEKENDIILETIKLLQEQDEEWIDDLPITMTKPYAFIEGKESQIEDLKMSIETGLYNDVDITYANLLDWYDLTDTSYTDLQKRQLVGIRHRMNKSGFNIKTPYVLAKDVSIQTVAKIKEMNFALQGVDYQQSSERQYIDGDIAPGIIGHIGMLTAEEYNSLTEQGKTFSSEKISYADGKKYLLSDRIGKDGIELAMEEELRGTTGTRQIVMNNKGDVLDYSVTKEPTPGNTVTLTIDSRLQRTAQQALEKEIHYLNQNAPEGKGREADAGAVVAIEIKTGDVLVAANYPSYNLETFRQDFEELNNDPLKPMVNRALMGQYRPGSCFKPIVATAGLDNNIIGPSSEVDCTYKYTYYDDYQPYCLSRHGPINVYSAIKHSCNIFFYDVGRRVGIDKINEYATGYGIGQPTGIEIGEGKGRLSSPKFSESMGVKWEAGNVLQASIGQLDTEATPIQLANYAATIANKGERMKLHFVKNIQSFDFKQMLYQNEPTVINKMETSPEVFDVVRDAMVQTQRSGSAASFLADYPIDIACKTGTPETTKTGLPNSTFICFAPADDPQIAIAVVIEKGWHGYTGAPVARAIFDEYFFGNSSPAVNQPGGTILE